MTARRHLLRASAYLDSVVLLQLQRELAAQPGVTDAAALMATPANLELLAASGLLPDALGGARPDDLLVVVAAADEGAADAALGRLDELLAARRPAATAHHPRSVDAALRQRPDAAWVLVSVPGRYAGEVARRALAAGRHVFLFSDNVSLEEEVALKREAARRDLLVMGPDCGTAVVAGVGLGFANRVRPGEIGVVAASGTGLQALCCHLDELGEGISHALGTGGRDLGAAVGGATAAQALALLGRDAATRVVVLVSKPPAPAVAGRLLAVAAALGKPVVAWLLGTPPPGRRVGGVWFAASAADAAELAARLAREGRDAGAALAGDAGTAATGGRAVAGPTVEDGRGPDAAAVEAAALEQALDEAAAAGETPAPRYVRGLFGGGTLALQAVAGLQLVCDPLFTNVPLRPEQALGDPRHSRGHTVVDLGADELTAGRPHPMLEPAILVDRLRVEAADPEVALVLFDMVLGDGAHPDPAAVIAPAVAAALASAAQAGRALRVVALVQGTSGDPQGTDDQAAALAAAGAVVCRSVEDAVGEAWRLVGAGAAGNGIGGAGVTVPAAGKRDSAGGAGGAGSADAGSEAPAGTAAPATAATDAPVPTVLPSALAAPLVAVNVGLASFHASLEAQGAAVVHVDWRPPAGGDPRLIELLRRMR